MLKIKSLLFKILLLLNLLLTISCAEIGSFNSASVSKVEDKDTKNADQSSQTYIFKTFDIVSTDIIAKITDQAQSFKSSEKNQFNIAKHAAGVVKKYPPAIGVKIKGQDFYLSERICSEKYVFAILYSLFGEHWYARPLYRSKSNGIWRSTHGSYGGVYQKGEHYTQDMRLDENLEHLLNTNFSKGELGCKLTKEDIVIKDFSLGKEFFAGILESQMHHLQLNNENDFNLFKNGEGFVKKVLDSYKEKTEEEIRKIFFSSMNADNLPAGFYPDFSHLVRSFKSSHTILSKVANVTHDQVSLEENINNDVFAAKLNDKKVEWTFSYEQGTKEPWISRIRFTDSMISSYGGDSDVILSGAITLKPFEYGSQLDYSINQHLIVEKEDYRNNYKKHLGYLDIRPFLQNFPPIIDYKKYKDKTNSWE